VTRLWLTPALRTEIEREAARAFPLETGGILMGYESAEGDFVATAVIGPGPNAVHAPTRFDHDSEWQFAEVARIYAASGRTETYLGDWHTHPCGIAAMSGLDASTLRFIAESPETRAPRAVMAILAGTPGGWEIGAWHWDADRPRAVKLA
jgi:integrative and conjugative element protein (TIGR02256 family)